MASPTLCLRPRWPFWTATLAYIAVCVGGVTLVHTVQPPPAWLQGGIVVTAGGLALVMLLYGPLQLRRREGVERSILVRSTSLAFFVTMATVLVCGLLEAFVRTAPLSAWWVWSVGMVSWLIVSLTLQWRLT
jgi:hypothetical protein